MEECWVIETCCNCHVPFKITAAHQDHLKQSHNTFYCPSGHSQYYPGETKAEKLEKELEYKQNHIKRLYDENENNLEKITDLKKQLKDATEKKIQEPSEQDNKKVVKKTVKKEEHRGRHSLFDKSQRITKINGGAIWQPIVDYLSEELPTGKFEANTIKALINQFYKDKLKRTISVKSVKKYALAYKKYLLTVGLIVDLGDRSYQLKFGGDSVNVKLDLPPKKPAVKKAPNNTMLFLNWLEKWENNHFTMGDIVKETSLSKEKALKIVDHQMELGNLKKISKWEFAKTKKSEVIDEQKGDVKDVKFDLQKPPGKLSCFEKWLNLKVSKKPFDIEQFYNLYPKQRQHKKHVEDVITELCAKGILIQLRGNLFRLPILKSEEET